MPAGRGVASSLVSDTQRTARREDAPGLYEIVALRAHRANDLASRRSARQRFPFDPGEAAPAPGLHTFDDWPLDDLRECIDWTPFFRAWELAGNYPAILTDPVVGESASNLFADAQAMLDRIISEKWLTAKAVAGLWRCRRDGDDVLVTARNEEVRLPFLRQQVKKREGRANMCLADFIGAARGLDGRLRSRDARARSAPRALKADHDDYSDILLKALPTGWPRPLPSGSTSMSGRRSGAMRPRKRFRPTI
jgi:5-methyltetrahydrofolate--homocysteine methyltransferase